MEKSKDYWIERFELLQEASLKKGEVSVKQIEKIYDKTITDVQNDIRSWYNRFALNNQVSFSDAKKMLKAEELQELKWTVEEYIKAGKENALDQRWMKELENASARVHISQLEALELQIKQKVELLHKEREKGLKELSKNIFEDRYYKTAYETQLGLHLGWNIPQLNSNLIESLLSKPWAPDGLNFSSRIWRDKEKLVETLHTELTQSFIRGESPKRVVDLIAKSFKTSRSIAGRLVMTESAFFASAAQQKAFKDLDVELYEIVATLDIHTSKKCQSLDGKVLPMSDYKPGITAPPFHSWCRTVTVPAFLDDLSIGERIARGIDGKVYYVPSDMKYKDWYKEYIINQSGEKQANFLKQSYKNIKSDKLQYKKYKALFGDRLPNSFEDFQKLKYNEVEEWETLKAKKQEILNTKDYKKSFYGMFGDNEVRKWYITHDKNIINLIDKSASIKDQAIQAHNLRNKYRSQARLMMSNRKKAEELNRDLPNSTFEELVQDKMDRKGLTREEAYRDVIKTAGKTNKNVNKRFNLE